MSHNTEPYYEVVPQSPWLAITRRLSRPIHFKQLIIIAIALVSTLLFFFSVNYGYSKDTIDADIRISDDNNSNNIPPPPNHTGNEDLVFGHPDTPQATTTIYSTMTKIVSETTTIEAPQHTSAPPSDIHLEEHSEPIVFSLLMYSVDSALEGAILMKVRNISVNNEISIGSQ